MKFFKGMAIGLTVAVIVSVTMIAVVSSLNRPQMIVDENGNCKSARGPQGSIMCADIKEEDWGNYDIEKAYKPLPKG